MSNLPEIALLPADSLSGQPWAAALHAMIIKAFKRKDIQAFPPSWTRLHQDPVIGIERLSEELGTDGHFAVLLIDGHPVGCGGILPFRGNDWINKEKSADAAPGEHIVQEKSLDRSRPSSVDEFEICCFCIHPGYRKQGLSKLLLDAISDAARDIGGERLVVNYSVEETGEYWPRLGFKKVTGATSILKKGFTHTIGMEGLRDDIHFQIATMPL